jgi:hypothetical protein
MKLVVTHILRFQYMVSNLFFSDLVYVICTNFRLFQMETHYCKRRFIRLALKETHANIITQTKIELVTQNQRAVKHGRQNFHYSGPQCLLISCSKSTQKVIIMSWTVRKTV